MKKLILLSSILFAVITIQAQWSVEGVNDAKGQYTNLKTMETWSVYYSDARDEFVALYANAEFKQGNEIVIDRIEKISEGNFKIHMKEADEKIAAKWILKYNTEKKFYDLHMSWFDAKFNKRITEVYIGSSDNG